MIGIILLFRREITTIIDNKYIVKKILKNYIFILVHTFSETQESFKASTNWTRKVWMESKSSR